MAFNQGFQSELNAKCRKLAHALANVRQELPNRPIKGKKSNRNEYGPNNNAY
jgi:hypothetical protein